MLKSLPTRKNIRLKNHDYSRNGVYFITICVKDKHPLLWEQKVVGAITNRPPLSEYGTIVENAINNISYHYPMVDVSKYVIMPNHVHIIMIITGKQEHGRLIIAPTTSVVVKQMKRYVSKLIGFSFWQKSYHDHIIQNQEEYNQIWQYIDDNPAKWKEDDYFIS